MAQSMLPLVFFGICLASGTASATSSNIDRDRDRDASDALFCGHPKGCGKMRSPVRGLLMQTTHQPFRNAHGVVPPVGSEASSEISEPPRVLRREVPRRREPVSAALAEIHDQRLEAPNSSAIDTLLQTLNPTVLADKPKGNPRQYQHTTLANGMQVVNVMDSMAKQGAFSVAVTAGLFYDPVAYAGLAHLTEHALFLGTQTYPDSSGFDRYLTRYGGTSNAYTEEEVTVYYGALDAGGFDEGMDRFAEFFKCPSLNASAIWKEVNAVNSEHSKNIQSPWWSTERAMKFVADDASPVQQFHTGDNASLSANGQEPLAAAIKDYFTANYCPPRMQLVTFSPDSLQSQLELAQKTFGAIDRGGLNGTCSEDRKNFSTPEAFPQTKIGKYLHIEGSSGGSELWILFPLDSLEPLHKTHPIMYINYMMSYEGESSLQRELRDKLGLSGSLEFFSEDSSAGTMVWVVMSLLNSGIDNPGAVLDVIFSFFEKIRRQGVSQSILTSLAAAAKLAWDWPALQEASNEVSVLAEEMTRLAPSELLSGDSLYAAPDTAKVMEVLNLLKPENMNVGLVDPEAAKYWDQTLTVKTVPHYDLRFTEAKITDVFTSSTNWGAWPTTASGEADALLGQRLADQGVTQSPSLTMPGPVTGLPSETGLGMDKATALAGIGSTGRIWGADPVKLNLTESALETDGVHPSAVELWHRQGWMLPQPKVIAVFTFRTNASSAELAPRQSLEISVGNKLLAEEMQQRLADLRHTGAFYSVTQWSRGISIFFGTFEESMPALVDRVLQEYNRGVGSTSQVQFRRVYGEVKGELYDDSKMPLTQALNDWDILLSPRTHSNTELIAASKGGDGTNVTRSTVAQAMADVKGSPLAGTAFIMGSYSDAQAKWLLDRSLESLKLNLSVPVANTERILPVVEPPSPVEVRKKNPRSGDKNHVTYVSILLGVSTVEQRVLLGLVAMTLSEIIFTELRTRMQLGYIVGGKVAQTSNVMYVTCYVQGEKMLPDEVEALCEWIFAKALPDRLANMTAEGFSARKEAYSSAILERPLSISEEEAHFESPILLGQCVGLHYEMLAFLETVTTSNQLLQAWNDEILPANGTRKKVVIKYWGDGTDIPAKPTPDEVHALTLAKEAGQDAADRMKREREATLDLQTVNSATRQQLVQQKGYYSTALTCSRAQAAVVVGGDGSSNSSSSDNSSSSSSSNSGSTASQQAPLVPTGLQPSIDSPKPISREEDSVSRSAPAPAPAASSSDSTSSASASARSTPSTSASSTATASSSDSASKSSETPAAAPPAPMLTDEKKPAANDVMSTTRRRGAKVANTISSNDEASRESGPTARDQQNGQDTSDSSQASDEQARSKTPGDPDTPLKWSNDLAKPTADQPVVDDRPLAHPAAEPDDDNEVVVLRHPAERHLPATAAVPNGDIPTRKDVAVARVDQQKRWRPMVRQEAYEGDQHQWPRAGETQAVSESGDSAAMASDDRSFAEASVDASASSLQTRPIKQHLQ